MQPTIAELVDSWRTVRDARLSLEAQAKEIKDGVETQLADQLAVSMQQAGLQNIAVKGVGKAYFTTDIKASLADPEKACAWMFETMAQAKASGRPLLDALILQKVPLKSGILDLIERKLGPDAPPEAVDAEAAALGVQLHRSSKLAFQAQKK